MSLALAPALALILQAAPPLARAPVLTFPEPGLDDTAAYQGYTTRFYRDSRDNAVQIYVEPRAGRVVNLWADAANESIGFTARDARGRPQSLAWGADSAAVWDSAGVRTVEYRLAAASPGVTLGWFLLGSMRVERDFQYWKRNLQPFTAPPFQVAEESLLVANVGRLPAAERGRHLALLRAGNVAALEQRLQPRIAAAGSDSTWSIRVERPSLDGLTHLTLELRGSPRDATARVVGRTVRIESRNGGPVRFIVRIRTDAAPLTPLARREIFTGEFLAFLASAGGGDSAGTVRQRRLERQVRSVELLASEEKLMAGLPNFATYFGRDMMMTALMMRSIWVPAMAEHVIAGVLRKLSPDGEVSHEEALGGQAIREHAAEYNGLIAAYLRIVARRGAGRTAAQGDSLLRVSRGVLASLHDTRENYHMLDDEFQLPVLVARYLADSSVPAPRKRAFLLGSAGDRDDAGGVSGDGSAGDGSAGDASADDGSSGGASRLALLLRELAVVAAETRPYVDDPQVTNLVSFVRRDSTHWRSASWRDSDAGYANGRFAMDINAIWAPQALEGIATILAALPGLGVTAGTLDSLAPGTADGPLGVWLRDPGALRSAIATWKGARRHFLVTLAPQEIRNRIRRRLAALPDADRRYWTMTMAGDTGLTDSLSFLALSLDAAGRPIPVVNTDPATDLFLGAAAGASDTARDEVGPFLRPYPAGLFVPRLGPLVANDAYASPAVWKTFDGDAYHSPRVVWGREVNLLLLGLADRIAASYDSAGRLTDPGREPAVRALGDALRRTLAAVGASGVEHNELWSYRIERGRLLPTRYGTSSDVQLWSCTDLAVQFALSRLPRP
jgi:hypothetical protein